MNTCIEICQVRFSLNNLSEIVSLFDYWIKENKRQLMHNTKKEGFTFEAGYVDAISRLQNMEDDLDRKIEKEKIG